jgi:predicted metal-binding protein
MQEDEQAVFLALIELAYGLGASHAAVIGAAQICVQDDLANLCREPQCENYGQAANCPPHVPGPSGLRALLKDFSQALVFKIDLPSQYLFSNERQDIFRLLHEIAAGIEQAAVQRGYRHATAYAGGSCKRIFCGDQTKCRVLGEGGQCRHPARARPSMSGFGINVSKLMQAAGWTLNRSSAGSTADQTSTGTVCGLVLLG